MPDGWGGMDEVPTDKLNLEEMEDREEQERKKVRWDDRRFIRKVRKQGETVDLLGQDSYRYNFHVKYTPPL